MLSAAAGAVLAATNDPATAPAADGMIKAHVYAHVESFEWKETLNGEQFMKETGPLYGLGADVAVRLSRRFAVEGNLDFFYGDVDYDGAIQSEDGSSTPYKTSTEYAGGQIELDLAFKQNLNKYCYLKPYAGLGLRAWQRNLDTKFASSMGQYGYTENWLTTYGILGLGGGVTLSAKTELFAKAQVKLPIYNRQEIDFSNLGGPSDITLEPGRRTSYSAEAGVTVHWFFASVFYETLKFSQSAPDTETGNFFQPDSEETIVGVKAGYAF